MKLRNTSFITLRPLFVAVALAAGAILPPQQLLAASRPVSILFAQFGEVTRSAEARHLNGFSRELRSKADAQGYIIAYGGRDSEPDVAQERADRAKEYLVTTRDIDPSRIVTVDGGYKEGPDTELWIVPSGATPPSVSPTVDR